MEEEQLIPADMICTHHNIQYAFIHSLGNAGLIEVSMVEGKAFVHPGQLSDLEKFICFHHELDINMEGIEAIAGLLQRMHDMQEEISLLKVKLRTIDL
ncbi:MAG: chaperone modulator CbpM [Chitinophagaceae bacterium]